jgi:hypothetical protein
MRAQLACLPDFLHGSDPSAAAAATAASDVADLASRIAHAWGELSTACHASEYRMAVDRHGIERCLATVAELGAHPASGRGEGETGDIRP